MQNSEKISIIIPTLNEGAHIFELIKFLQKCYNPAEAEIIVSDGQSTDNTVDQAKAAGAKVLLSPLSGRAYQMNFGAAISNADILYFVHADTFPPQSFYNDIISAVSNGFQIGRYQTRFNSKSLLLRINSFFTRFDFNFCNGGDQTLFIEKKLFKLIGGFDSNMIIMEDYDIVKRARQHGYFKILSHKVLVSARKYEANSWLKVQLANLKIMRMFNNGVPQEEMIKKYKELVKYR